MAHAVRSGPNAQLPCVAAGAVVLLGLGLGFAPWEWAAVFVCVGAVLAAETFNTALEELCDEVSTEHRPRLGRAKNMAAGTVLIMALISVAVLAAILAGRWRG